MTKNELIDDLDITYGDSTTRRVIENLVNGLFDAITDALRDGETVTITGFGVFERVYRRERIGHNPATGGTVSIPAKNVAKFRPGATLKRAVA